jgi:hypothetical protein
MPTSKEYFPVILREVKAGRYVWHDISSPFPTWTNLILIAGHPVTLKVE